MTKQEQLDIVIENINNDVYPDEVLYAAFGKLNSEQFRRVQDIMYFHEIDSQAMTLLREEYEKIEEEVTGC